MKTTIRTLTAALAATVSLSAFAANTPYYYDRNGPESASGVVNGASYLWNTNDVFWNSAASGDGSGLFTNWLDCAALGLTPGTTAAAQNTWAAHFSAGAPGSTYSVIVPAGEVRDFFYAVANKDNVTLSGTVRPQGINTYDCGFMAINPGIITLSNLTVLTTNCNLVKFADGGSYNGRFVITPTVNVGLKQWVVGAYTTVDFGSLLDKNLIFTTNYPGGGRIAALFFNGYGDNQVIQGNGMLTVPLANWYSGPFPCLSWNPDGYGNGQGGGFAARGGKLTVNLFGDGRSVTWNGNGSATNFFCGKPFSLIFNSSTADSPVEFQNGIDLAGGSAKVKVLTPVSPNAVAIISGAITDSVGSATLTKETQNGYQASGTLVLSGANTYSGRTYIREGKLVVTSAHQGGGNFDVNGNGDGSIGLGVRVTSSTTPVPMSALTFGYNYVGTNTLEINYCATNTIAAIMATNLSVDNEKLWVKVGGRLSVGQFPLLKYESFGGAFGFSALELVSLPPGVTATLVDNPANFSVDLNVTAVATQYAAKPAITGLRVAGGQVAFVATNGVPDCGCTVLSSAAVTAPVAGWTPAATATFDANGTFLFASPLSTLPQFFTLRQP